MPTPLRIVTCCYCGTRAALALDRARHELACVSCAAPLHSLKMMPRPSEYSVRPHRVSGKGSAPSRPAHSHEKSTRKTRGKGLKARIRKEIKDAIEDVFD